MPSSKRRKFLKLTSLLGASGATSIWKKPAVESVVLPGHASTSCFAESGCYDTSYGSFFWPESGVGPQVVSRINIPCSGTIGVLLGSREYVVAASPADAAVALFCDEVDVFEDQTTPSLPGCGFYSCDED